MGYFSQRKKHERANLILNITLTVIAVFTVLSFLTAQSAVFSICSVSGAFIII